MNHAGSVRGGKRVRNLDTVSDRLLERQSVSRRYLVKPLPGYILHDNEVHAGALREGPQGLMRRGQQDAAARSVEIEKSESETGEFSAG
jgi:hypothetical protein